MKFQFLIATFLITDFIFGEQNIKDQECPENSLYFFKNKRHFCWNLVKSPYLNFGQSEGLCVNDHGRVPIISGPEDIATVSELIRNKDWKFNETSNVCFYRDFFQFSQPILAVNYPRTPEYIKQLNNKNKIYFDKKFETGDRIIISFVQKEEHKYNEAKLLFFTSKRASSPSLSLSRTGQWNSALRIAIGDHEPDGKTFNHDGRNYGITIVIDISPTHLSVKVDNEMPKTMITYDVFENTEPGYLTISNVSIVNLEHRKTCGEDQAKMSILEGIINYDVFRRLALNRIHFYLPEIADAYEPLNMKLISVPHQINDLSIINYVVFYIRFEEEVQSFSYIFIHLYTSNTSKPWRTIEITDQQVRLLGATFSTRYNGDISLKTLMKDSLTHQLGIAFNHKDSTRFVRLNAAKEDIPLPYDDENPIKFLKIDSDMKIIGTEMIPNPKIVTYSIVKTCNFRIEFDKISDTVPYDDKCPDHTMVLCEKELKNVKNETRLKPTIEQKLKRLHFYTEMRISAKFDFLHRIQAFVGVAVGFMIMATFLEFMF